MRRGVERDDVARGSDRWRDRFHLEQTVPQIPRLEQRAVLRPLDDQIVRGVGNRLFVRSRVRDQFSRGGGKQIHTAVRKSPSQAGLSCLCGQDSHAVSQGINA
ncbi:MAG: hypothetical protein RR506_08720 [Akkermansia sp.]